MWTKFEDFGGSIVVSDRDGWRMEFCVDPDERKLYEKDIGISLK